MEKETVTISKFEYEKLLRAEAHLQQLIEAGVDNWDGYRSYNPEDEEPTDE